MSVSFATPNDSHVTTHLDGWSTNMDNFHIYWEHFRPKCFLLFWEESTGSLRSTGDVPSPVINSIIILLIAISLLVHETPVAKLYEW